MDIDDSEETDDEADSVSDTENWAAADEEM